MRTLGLFLFYVTAAITIAIAPAMSTAQTSSGASAAPPKYSPDVPAKITTPDTVETRIGTLRFKDGAPDPATVQLAYDQLDFSRGVDAFLTGTSATSVYAMCRGLADASIKENEAIGITENLLDARSLFLTPNTTTVYVFTCLNLKDGPMVMRVPPGVLGAVDDADFRWVTDVGLTGQTAAGAVITCSCRPDTRELCPAKATTSQSRGRTGSSCSIACSSRRATSQRR